MHITLYLPIAGVSVNIFLLFGMGVVVGFISGMFGVGGGFLLTPLLIMIGIPPTVAAASDSNQIVAATCSGTYAHWKLGNVDAKLGLFLLAGGLFGGTIGVEIIKILRQAGNADFLIKICYVLILSIVGGYMFQESLRSLMHRTKMRDKSPTVEKDVFSRIMHVLPWKVVFRNSGLKISVLAPIIIGFLIGLLAAIMGIGGGFIMVPALVYFLRIPMHVVVGTNLFQEIFMCINITILQATINHTVDVVLALLLLLGSTSGAQFGARIGNKLKADQLKILLASIILLVMLDMAFDLLLPPDQIFSLKGAL